VVNKILHKNISGVPVHAWLLLAVICIIGYWPVSSNLFSLKNDAYIYFLPCRHFISESIRSGHLPLWDPYFYMGFPMHGDMQSGAWNPVVWIFSLLGKYNMTMLQYETLLYIFISGIGMYKLLGSFSASHYTKLIIASSYMFCGFIIDTGQITVWTGSAAFIPFVFLYYYRLLNIKNDIYKNVLKTSLALFMLLTAGYPSFLIMCCYILFFSMLCRIIAKTRQNGFNKKFVADLIKANTLLCVVFLLISLPALLSYIDYFPYYQRSSGTSLAEAQENPFNLFALISYLFPLSVTRDHALLSTDPTARSGYIGLLTLIILAGIFRKKMSGLQKFILISTLFIFLFSLGDATPVRRLCYNYIPLMNLFRHPATMRIFTTIGLLLLSSFYLDDLFIALKNRAAKFYVRLCIAFTAIISMLLMFYLRSSSLTGKISSIGNSSPAGNIRSFLKDMYADFSFADAIILEGFLQILFLIILIMLMRKPSSKKTTWIIVTGILNPLLLAQFSIPNTFVTKQSPARINQFISKSPAGYPIPGINTSIEENNIEERATNREYGCASFYTKKIVQVKEELNPSFTKSLKSFDSAVIISSIVLQYPVCYFADTLVHYSDSAKMTSSKNKILFIEDGLTLTEPGNDSSFISIKQFAPWGLIFETNTTTSKPFVLFQNYNKNWKLLVDGKDTEIRKGNLSFMYSFIEKGKHKLQFYYKPGYINYTVIISLVTFLTVLLFLMMKRKSKIE